MVGDRTVHYPALCEYPAELEYTLPGHKLSL